MVVAVSLVSTSIGATPNYMPLQEGKQWAFAMTTGMQATMQVVGFADVGKVHCAILETTVGLQKNREYVAADAEGVKTYMSQGQGQELRYDPPLLRIKLPYREGDVWTATVNQRGRSLTTTFQSIGKERVQTPAGIFDCIKVSSMVSGATGVPAPVSINYYADGIGPVRWIMQMGGQALNATLVSTGIKPISKTPAPTEPEPVLKPMPETPAAPPAPTPAKIRCPKCGAQIEAEAKFCPECGQRIAAPAPTPEPNRPTSPTPASSSSLERYQSPDGKVVLYKPKNWNVAQGNMFGPSTYGVTVLEPQENAAVLFITVPVGAAIKDSVELAANCIAALHARYPDLRVTNSKSTPDRERTLADLTLTTEGQKGMGHGYFFHSQKVGSVYILLARATKWNEFRPILTTIAANLAYAPQGVAAVQQQGRQATSGQTPATPGATPPPAAMLQRAAQQPGKQVPLQPAALADQSLSLQIPQGWTLEGAKVQYALVDNAQTRARGLGSLSSAGTPSQFSIPNVINAPYQPPPQALKLVLENGKSTRDVQVISECPVEQATSEFTQIIQQMRGQGLQVDARLIHVKFRNVPTGMTCRGLFSVLCSVKPANPLWQVSIQGSWAPDAEYEEWLPLYLRVEKTVQVNPQWMSQEMQNQAVRQQQLNRNLQRSIAESQRAFDGYMGAVREGERSRDYTSHMWSQTTLGQGTWVAENEGAKIYQTDSWGLEGPEGRIDGKAYNTANFDGMNPWTGGQLTLVNTRAEYEKYMANK
jgi:hypothetical protein